MENPLRVRDAARWVVEEVDRLLDSDKLLRQGQLRESVESITSNIRDAYGQRPGRARAKFFVHARGSAEATDEHLWANWKANRVDQSAFWRIHNRIAVVVRMLNKLIEREDKAA